MLHSPSIGEEARVFIIPKILRYKGCHSPICPAGIHVRSIFRIDALAITYSYLWDMCKSHTIFFDPCQVSDNYLICTPSILRVINNKLLPP